MTSGSKERVRIRQRKKRKYYTSLEFRWAFIVSLFYLLWVILEFEFGLKDKDVHYIMWVTSLVEIPIFLLYLLGINEKKNGYFNGKMKYKHGFNTGFAITVFATILAPINQLIIHKIVFPTFFSEAITSTVNEGALTQENANAFFNLSTFMWLSIVFTFLFGLLFSFIAALILKNREG